MSCPECERLKAEIDRLNAEYGVSPDQMRLDIVRRRLGLTHMQGALLLRLYAGAGRAVPNWALLQDLHGEEPSAAALKVHIGHLRRILGRESIETAREVGYRLSPVGRALVYQAFNPKRLETADSHVP